MVIPPPDFSKLPPKLRAEADAVLDCLVPHPHLLDAHRQVRHAMMMPQGYGVVLVVGPAGVGKSALATACRVVDPRKEDSPIGLPISDGAVPIVSVTARSGQTFLSRWKAVLLEILRATNPPLTSKKAGDAGVLAPSAFEGLPIPRLEEAAIEALRLRKTVALLLDEAQDLAPFNFSADAIQFAKSIKHLGSALNTVLILFGSYELLDFLQLSVQFSRRCSVVHFPHYDASKPQDLINFQRTLSTFCAKAPTLLPYAELSQHVPFLYTGSGGGVGNLRLWLMRALGRAAGAPDPKVTLEILKDAPPLTHDTITGLFKSAQAGKERINGLYGDLDQLITQVFAGVPFDTSTPTEATVSSPERRGNRRPGTRLANRDRLS